ncbi:MAG: cation:proton antiporter, partial [Nitrososphaerales archaeon]
MMLPEVDTLRTVASLGLLIFIARVFAALVRRVKIPECVGLISAGIVFGPYALGGHINLFGKPLIEFNELTVAFSEMGAVIVLFAAGLEFSYANLRKIGGPSFLIGSAGVIIPFFLGYGASLLLNLKLGAALIIGAALTATSIAITVEVLREIGRFNSMEGRVIVNAALIDDVLGLTVLAIVTSIGLSGADITLSRVLYLVIVSISLWLVMLITVSLIFPRIVNLAAVWKARGTVEALATGLCFATAAAAYAVGLSPIVGAFAAGMALAGSKAVLQISEFTSKLELVFGPIFFASIGAYVNPSALVNLNVLLFLIMGFVAIISKMIGCGLPALLIYRNRKIGMRVGIGMVSRGEVGFIILGIGLGGALLDT